MADFSTIETKIRRITQSPSKSDLTKAQIQDYVNDFILNDMPERMRTFSLRKQFSFYTEPNVGSYASGSTTELDDFKQKNLTVHAPFYVAGVSASYSQDISEFTASWPSTATQTKIAGADGTLAYFSGTLADFPIQKNKVLFTATTSTGTGLKLTDDGNGSLVGDTGIGVNIIDYATGAYYLTFSEAPKTGTSIYAQVHPYVANKPTSILYYADVFTVRPIPDRIYQITFTVQCRPTDLWDADSDEPMLQENWKYIAYGAAIEVLRDRGDDDTLEKLYPRFEELENLAERRTTVQYMDERAPTIFTNTSSSFSPFDR